MENSIDFINMVRRQIEETETYLHYMSVLSLICRIDEEETHYELMEELEKRCLKAGVYTGRYKELNNQNK